MKLELFNYELPKKLIAQEPLDQRDASRLMVVKGKYVEHKHFRDILEYLDKDDVLVLNDTKVEPVKLIGNKTTGAKSEFIVSKKLSKRCFLCQIASKNVRKGTTFEFKKNLSAKVNKDWDGLEFEVEFNRDDVEELLQEIGEMPVPPYIKQSSTKEKYQTVYAKHSGSIAAPTAGFHFTPELLRDLETKGVKIVYITLTVGYSTFLPVKTDDIADHDMHEEWFSISKKSADIINNRKKKLIIVGTTALRALESATDDLGILKAKTSTTDIFIYPGYKFKLRPDMMITNFHLPKSTLIMLIAALVGRENILKAYKEAVKEKYRFYSFGDAMLLVTE